MNNNTNNTFNNSDSCNCSYIKETIIKIDGLQKDVVSDAAFCVSCETSLYNSANNTIPVRLTYCGGTVLEAVVGMNGDTTTYFRVESVRCGQYATLRLLSVEGTGEDAVVTGTNYTITVDLDCIGAIQCFEPTTVEVCTASSAA